MHNAKVSSFLQIWQCGDAAMSALSPCRITAELHSSASSDDDRLGLQKFDSFRFCLQANLREQLQNMVQKSRAQAGFPAFSIATRQ